MAEETQDSTCQFEGPDGDGFFWLRRTDTGGAFGMINLGCCDEPGLLEAMAMFLASKETGDPPLAQQS